MVANMEVDSALRATQLNVADAIADEGGNPFFRIGSGLEGMGCHGGILTRDPPLQKTSDRVCLRRRFGRIFRVDQDQSGPHGT
jgi:hypothetical protein